jgi:5-hydroxyisourate hydrolase
VSLSTHVLDVGRGEPAAGVLVRLQRGSDSAGWVEVARGETDHDGRLRDWSPGQQLPAGRYRLIFATGGDSFPEVPVVFEVTDPDRHVHIPLLLSPFGYTTYRGS